MWGRRGVGELRCDLCGGQQLYAPLTFEDSTCSVETRDWEACIECAASSRGAPPPGTSSSTRPTLHVRSAPHGSSLLCGTAVRAVATAYAYGERFCIIIDDMGRLVLT